MAEKGKGGIRSGGIRIPPIVKIHNVADGQLLGWRIYRSFKYRKRTSPFTRAMGKKKIK